MRLRFPGISRPTLRWLAVVSLSALAVGCRPAEQITKYTAPKDPPDIELISDAPEEGEPKVRILGAIVPVGKPEDSEWYFVKFQPARPGGTYSPKAIERHKADFDAFLQSLRFHGDRPPTWTVPKGWREATVESGVQRIVTLRMKKSVTVVDLAVSQVKGSLLENINRWRVQQAGIEPITEAEIESKCRVLMVDGRKVYVVDVSGPGAKGGGMMPK
jgi:hypothetical protein